LLRSLFEESSSQLSEILSLDYKSASSLSLNVSCWCEELADLEISDIFEFHAMQRLCARLIQRLLRIVVWLTFRFETTSFFSRFIQQRSSSFDRSRFFDRSNSDDLDEIDAKDFIKNSLSCDHLDARHSYYKRLISMRRRIISSQAYFKCVDRNVMIKVVWSNEREVMIKVVNRMNEMWRSNLEWWDEIIENK
jgi:hypothetical protein